MPANIHARLLEVARHNDRSVAQLVREFAREYISKNAQGDLFAAHGQTR
jgi:hypothetical protein